LFEAPMFATDDVRPAPTMYSIAHLDGTTQMRMDEHLRLSTPFKPLTLTESAGVLVRPFEDPRATIVVRLGGGARETLANGVLVVADASMPTIALKEVDDVFQGGVEGAIGISGKLPEQKITYGVDFGALLPLINNDK